MRSVFQLATQNLIRLEYDDEFLKGAYIAITRKGATLWESWAEPDWNLYFEDTGHHHHQSVDDEHTTLISVEINAVSQQRLADAITYYITAGYGKVIAVSDRIECREWEVTEWKTLPTYYSQNVILKRDEQAQGCSETVNSRDHIKGFHRWRKRGFNTSECFDIECDEPC